MFQVIPAYQEQFFLWELYVFAGSDDVEDQNEEDEVGDDDEDEGEEEKEVEGKLARL